MNVYERLKRSRLHIGRIKEDTHGLSSHNQLTKLSTMVLAGLLTVSGAAVAAPTIILDTGGHDQIDGGNGAQSDLSGVGIDGATFAFAWDETDLSGANSNDTCTYFQDPDGSFTSVCYSVQFEAGTIKDGFPTYDVYDCGIDGYSNGKCSGNNPISTEYTVSCTSPVLVDPYFTQDLDKDLEASCTLLDANTGEPVDSLQYITTCSKPSASPSSQSKDCIFSPDNDPGFLSLLKVVEGEEPLESPSSFTLTATQEGSDPVVTVSGAGGVAITTVDAGDWTITESSSFIDDGSYTLESINCATDDGDPVNLDDPDTAEVESTVTVASLSTTTCTVTNTKVAPTSALVTVAKVLAGDTYTGTEGFSIDVDCGDQGSQTYTFDSSGNLDPAEQAGLEVEVGTECTVTETDPGANWEVSYSPDEDTAVAGAQISVVESGSSVTVTNTYTAPVPSLTISKSATGITDDKSEFDTVGDVISYSITVENTGEVDLTSVAVSDANCDAAPVLSRGDSNSNAILETTETWVYTCTHTVTQADLDAGEVVNVAGVTTGEICDDPEAEGYEEECTDTITVPGKQDPELAIVKTLDPAEQTFSEVGDKVTFTIVATNTGNTTLMNVLITDETADLSACSPENGSDLAPRETLTCTATHTITDADIETGSYQNTACVDDGAEGATEVCDNETVESKKVTVTLVKFCQDTSGVNISCGDTVFPAELSCTGFDTVSGNIGTDSSLSIANVPVGTKCSATEGDLPNDWVGVNTSTKLTASGDDSLNELKLTNMYDPRYRVRLRKRVRSPYGVEFPDQEFTIAIQCEGYDGTYTSEITLNALGKSSGKIIGKTDVLEVPYGATCRFSETDNPIGADWLTAKIPSKVTVKRNLTRTIVNTYRPRRDLTVMKVVVNNTNPQIVPDRETFDIQVNCTGGDAFKYNKTFNRTIEADGKLTISNIPVNAVCSVTETDPGANWLTPIYSGPITVSTDSADNQLMITNTFEPAVLTLTKLVVNSEGYPLSILEPGDWTLSATGTSSFSGNGTVSRPVAPGTYTLTENSAAASAGRYDAGPWVCNGETLSGNQVTLAQGDNVSCTITNTFVPQCETAFAFGNKDFNGEDNIFSNGRWGWANYFGSAPVDKTVTLYAGQDTDVGTLRIQWDGSELTLTANVTDPWIWEQIHLQADDQLPEKNAPGQYNLNDLNWEPNADGTFSASVQYQKDELWLIWHAEVCH